MAGTAEDRAGTVLHQYEVGDVKRNRLAVDERVANAKSGIEAFFLGFLDVRFAGAHSVALLDEGGELGIVRRNFGGNRMVCRDGAERHAEDRIVSRRIDLEGVVPAFVLEADVRAFRTADPVLLHQSNTVRPALEL